MRHVFSLVHIALAAGLIAFIAMNARRVGKALWLLAALPVIHILLVGFSLVLAMIPTMNPSTVTTVFTVMDLSDAGLSAISAIVIVIGCALLR